MAEDFLLRALAAGGLTALVAGPLGCFVLWRRMVYFGAALAHAALLGIALGFLIGVSPQAGMLGVALLVSLAAVALEERAQLAADTVLAILAHSTLAAGIIVLSLIAPAQSGLLGYLFGDILAVSGADLMWVAATAAAGLLLLAVFWRRLLLVTLHPDLAAVDGVHATAVRLLLMLLLSLVIAVSMQIVGLLLVVSLLILPAAAARRVARTPEAMAAVAAATGMAAVAAGLQLSLWFDFPTGPAIVAAATVLFALSLAVRRR